MEHLLTQEYSKLHPQKTNERGEPKTRKSCRDKTDASPLTYVSIWTDSFDAVFGQRLRLAYAVSTTNNGSPYSTGCPFSIRIDTTFPLNSDSISFISFIASTMHTICPFLTALPTSTND